MKWVDSKLVRTALSSFPLSNIRKGLRFIFVFHDVSSADAYQYHGVYSTEIGVFQNQLEWLKNNFQLISLDDLIQTDLAEENYASVVFDDGFKSVRTNALPVLQKKKIPFTIFLNQNAVKENWLWCSNLFMAHKHGDEAYMRKIYDHFGFEHLTYERFRESPAECVLDENKLANDYSIFYDEKYSSQDIYLNEADIYALLEQNCGVGSHTVNHKILSSCNDLTLTEEIGVNNSFIEGLAGRKVDHFAIPFGFEGTYHERVIEVAKKYHSCIYTTERNYFEVGNHTVFPRIGIRNDTLRELTFAINLPSVRAFRNKIFR